MIRSKLDRAFDWLDTLEEHGKHWVDTGSVEFQLDYGKLIQARRILEEAFDRAEAIASAVLAKYEPGGSAYVKDGKEPQGVRTEDNQGPKRAPEGH